MRRIAFGAGLVGVLAVAAQLVLPAVAERRVREDLERAGASVTAVDVEAFPAVELLAGHADRVEVRLSEARLGGAGELAAQLERTRGVGRLDARADLLRLGPLRLRDLRVRKAGERLSGEASVTRADLSSAMPVDVGLRPVEAGGGQLVLQAVAGPVSVRARLSARDGALVIAPDGLLSGLASVTVFDDPRVLVDGVGARPRPDGFTLTAAGRLG